MSPRHFLDLWRLDAATLRAILDDAARRKAARVGRPHGWVDADAPGRDRVLAMLFEKHSTRTRFSFDAAMRQLGGSTIIVNSSETQVGRGEPAADTARVLSRMVDAVMIRAVDHEEVERFAQACTAPVINGLTDKQPPLPDPGRPPHPGGGLRAAAARAGRWPGWATATTSAPALIHAAGRFGFDLNDRLPGRLPPRPDGPRPRATPANRVRHRPRSSARRWRAAHAVVTDTWVSMGDADHDARLDAFEPLPGRRPR